MSLFVVVSSFKYATPTFITKALRYGTQVQLLLTTIGYSELMPYTVLAYSYQVTFHAKAVATAYHVSIICVTDYNEYSQSIYTINSI